jgi:outer membrane usher protein FimD/PapC
MSKNFRSSFIDLLCCRYSKRRFCGPNESLRNRRAADNNNSKYRKSDYMIRSSVASRCSQLNPITGISTTGGGAIYASSSHLTTELIPKFEQQEPMNNEKEISIDNPSSCHITVGTQTNTLNKSHRQRKHGDRSPVVTYSSLPSQSIPKPTEMLCT